MRPSAAIANWRFRIVAERPRGKQKDPGALRSRSAAILKCQFAIAALDLPQAAQENTPLSLQTPILIGSGLVLEGVQTLKIV